MLSIKVTRIANKWHARLLEGTKVLDEMACQNRQDIGWICREMLRWYDKCGEQYSKLAVSARERQSKTNYPIGKVWSYNQLKLRT